MGFGGRVSVNLILSLLAMSAVQCSNGNHESSGKNSSEAAEGGQFPGGGDPQVSSRAEVNAALDLALSLASDSDPHKNVIVQFWMDKGRTSSSTFIQTPSHLFPNISGAISEADKDPKLFESPYLAALKKNKMTRLDSGDCLNTTTQPHKDASVSSFDVSATLCFSVGNLTHLPPSSLLREVLSLVLHEAIHMGGGEEPEAQAWQAAFSQYFGVRFGDLSADTVTGPTQKALRDIQLSLREATQMASKNPQDARVFEKAGLIVNALSSLPGINDPLLIQLKVKPAKPELIDVYSSSVLTLVQKLKLRFDVRTDTLLPKAGIRIPLDFMPTDRVLSTLEEVSRDLDKIHENFLAFSDGYTVPRANAACRISEDN